MLNLQRASIDYDDDAAPPILRGAVTANGRRAIVWERDPVAHRNVQRDVIVNATVTENPDGTATIQGVSTYLAETVGVPANQRNVTIRATPLGGCKDCGK